MRGETVLDWEVAAGWLVRACATYETGGNQSGGQTRSEEHTHVQILLHLNVSERTGRDGWVEEGTLV